MADLTEGFSMGETRPNEGPNTPNDEVLQGQRWILSILEDIYKHEQGKRTPLQEAQRNVYACEQVSQFMTDATSWWHALTCAIVATLEEYPLKGKQG